MTRWSHVGLNCRDQQATEEFYTRWFGFHRARTVPAGDGQIVFLRNGDAYLELFPTAGESADRGQADGPTAPGGVRHIAFQTDSVDLLLVTMGDAAEVTLGPLDFDEVLDGWRTIWLRDPDGVVVEVSQGYRDQESIDLSEGASIHV
ncbi:VOC family protein [Kitasatospora sp. MAP5-34]|uniref:VOC family protein n=1 Tax=Kitasatospora sp. MAP5-34 TaxID=3035102 RepID=UPI0024747F77|nr:VOC family protein [Kitasatospora sp. MAP5-34]MDH6574766.1 glyoxylase I family protein [Kitasatospora sp. MAP5-34]